MRTKNRASIIIWYALNMNNHIGRGAAENIAVAESRLAHVNNNVKDYDHGALKSGDLEL